MPPNPQDDAPSEPRRIQSFAKFFKNYMSVSALVTAALPIPITTFHLIPTYKSQTGFLAVYSSLFCFLILGFIFYSRHSLARFMFPGYFDTRLNRFKVQLLSFLISILPATLILSSLFCVLFYHNQLDISVAMKANVNPYASPPAFSQSLSIPKGPPNTQQILENTENWETPVSGTLMLLYLGIFIFAESAFVLMAIKEYLQDLVKLSELELIAGPRLPAPEL